MEYILSKWYAVEDCMPGISDKNETDWKIVRCINGADFYFLAAYSHEDNKWEFFDDSDDDNYQDTMQVTHWMNPLNIPFDIKSGVITV